jgi:hypothetical protein
MDRESCVPIEELEAVLARPAGDPRRRHVETCPRCRARALSLREFVTMPEDVPGALLAEADANLAAVLRRELALDPSAAPASDASAVRRPRWGTPWRMVFAGVAFAAVALVSVRAIQRRMVEETPVMRGTHEGTAAAPEALRAVPGEGQVTLTWSAAAGADDYQVTLYSADLTEIVRLPPTADTKVVVTHADLPPPAAAGTLALWRVTARAQGDELGVSAPGTLRLP